MNMAMTRTYITLRFLKLLALSALRMGTWGNVFK